MTKTLETSESLKRFELADRMDELKRLATFHYYPDGDTPSPMAFARGGFTYSGEGHKVSCPLCKLELNHLRREDNPAEEHRLRSPNCRLGSSTNDTCRLTEVSPVGLRELRPLLDIYNAAVKRSGKHNAGVSAAATSCEPTLGVDRENPNFELLRMEKLRLETFYDWPSTAHASPTVLARAGFFYTGHGDRVYCAFCRKSLRSWVPEDDPFEEHRKHYPDCPFVRNMDVANVRIEDKCTNHESNFSELEQGYTTMSASASAGQTDVRRLLEAYMNTPTVRAVVEMGFSKESIEPIVKEEFNNSGEFFQDAESLMEKLLSCGIVRTNLEDTPSTNEAASVLEPETRHEEDISAEAEVLPNPEIGDNRQENGLLRKRRKSKKLRKKNRILKEREGGSATGVNDEMPSTSDRPGDAVSLNYAASNTAEEEAIVNFDLEEQQLMMENSKLKEARTCKVCMDKEVNTVFLPCGHLICCSECSPQVRKCPLCRTFIRGTVKTYLS